MQLAPALADGIYRIDVAAGSPDHAERERTQASEEGLQQGPRIRTWINGEAIADIANEEIDTDHARGKIGLQMHGIKNFIEPREIAWKNIRITELKADADKTAEP